jgi:hypothetical protein
MALQEGFSPDIMDRLPAEAIASSLSQWHHSRVLDIARRDEPLVATPFEILSLGRCPSDDRDDNNIAHPRRARRSETQNYPEQMKLERSEVNKTIHKKYQTGRRRGGERVNSTSRKADGLSWTLAALSCASLHDRLLEM